MVNIVLIRVLAAIALLVTLVQWPVQPASACSCAWGDPRERLENADTAFVGRVISHVGPQQGLIRSSADPVTYTFEVEASVKGDIGEQVEVVSAASGASCGFEFGIPNGERAGILLHLDNHGNFRSGLCSTIDPDVLLEITGARPAPDGSGPLRFLIAGQFGGSRLFALDNLGRTLAYGDGNEPAGGVSVCPGDTHSIEVFGAPNEVKVGVRDLRTFEIVDEVSVFDNLVELYDGQYSEVRNAGIPANEIMSTACMRPDGSSSAFFSKSHGGYSNSVLIKVDTDPNSTANILWTGISAGAEFSPDKKFAYLVSGTAVSPPEYQITSHVIQQIDLDTGDVHEVVAIPRSSTESVASIAVSPSSEMLAIVFIEERKPWDVRLVLVDTDFDPVHITETQMPGGSAASRVLW